jgi:hypothetical protein
LTQDEEHDAMLACNCWQCLKLPAMFRDLVACSAKHGKYSRNRLNDLRRAASCEVKVLMSGRFDAQEKGGIGCLTDSANFHKTFLKYESGLLPTWRTKFILIRFNLFLGQPRHHGFDINSIAFRILFVMREMKKVMPKVQKPTVNTMRDMPKPTVPSAGMAFPAFPCMVAKRLNA